MKITFKKKRWWRNGDTTIITVYLWWPKFLDNQYGEKSIRWLEYATIRYRYCHCLADHEWPHWQALNFIDEGENG